MIALSFLLKFNFHTDFFSLFLFILCRIILKANIAWSCSSLSYCLTIDNTEEIDVQAYFLKEKQNKKGSFPPYPNKLLLFFSRPKFSRCYVAGKQLGEGVSIPEGKGSRGEQPVAGVSRRQLGSRQGVGS